MEFNQLVFSVFCVFFFRLISEHSYFNIRTDMFFDMRCQTTTYQQQI